MPKKRDLKGQVFGRWTVIEKGPIKGKDATWKCKCECGAERYVAQFSLRRGMSLSCGCLRSEQIIERKTKHNMCGTPEYNSWSLMLQRCLNERNKHYNDYGGRGITVCERWQQSFNNFFDDMGPKPSEKHSIDRINVDGNYEPSNCKWADLYEQARNKRIKKINKSGVTGVHWDKLLRKWRVQIHAEVGKVYLGVYEDFKEAVKVRKDAELKYWGKTS